MIDLNSIDTSRFYFFDPKDKMFLRNMEEIKQFRFNVKGLSSKKALTYITLMYDRNSELVRTIANYPRRKRIAVLASGFEMDEGGHFDNKVKDMLTGKIPEFNKAMIYYCCKQREPLVVRLAVLEHVQMDLARKALDEYDDRLHKLSDEVANRIKEIREELFFGEETEDVIKAVYEEIDDMELGLEVENIVDKISGDGLKEFGDYTYGREYKKPEVKFAGAEIPKE